jgi:hypothetical protein
MYFEMLSQVLLYTCNSSMREEACSTLSIYGKISGELFKKNNRQFKSSHTYLSKLGISQGFEMPFFLYGPLGYTVTRVF